jgi:hypothetical protein
MCRRCEAAGGLAGASNRIGWEIEALAGSTVEEERQNVQEKDNHVDREKEYGKARVVVSCGSLLGFIVNRVWWKPNVLVAMIVLSPSFKHVCDVGRSSAGPGSGADISSHLAPRT